MDDEFWIYDPSTLIRPDRLVEFYPTIDMSPNEKLNSICRFILYTGIIIAFLKRKAWPIAVSLLSTIATSLIHEKEDNVMKNLGKSRVKLNDFDTNFEEDKEAWISVPTCREQTDENPFGNPLPTDYKTPTSLSVEACKNNPIRLNEGNSNDPFGSNNRMTNFGYTIPGSSTPNNRAKYLESIRQDKVCRSGDQEVCTGYN